MIRKASQLFNWMICHPAYPPVFFGVVMLTLVTAAVVDTMNPAPDTEPAPQTAPRNLPESNVILQR
ncbi:hypothetical protein D3C72_1895850 [compost metagenome]